MEPRRILFAAQFLIGVDGLAVAIALPELQAELRLEPADGQWVLSAYSIAFGGLLLVGGRLADAHGARRLLVAGLALFGAAGAAAAAAPGLALLLAARALQGAGAAAAVPASLALAAELHPAGPERARALSWLAVAASAGVLCGLLFGGAVCDLLGWRAVFGLVAPAAAGAALVARRLPARDGGRAPAGGTAGGLLVTAAAALLIAAAAQVAHGGAGGPAVPGLALAGLACLAAFARHQRRSAHPLLPPGLLRVRRLRIASIAAVANAGAFSAIVYVGPLQLQSELGYRPLEAAAALAPLDAVSLLAGAGAGRLLARAGPRPACVAGFGASAAALAWLARAPADATYAIDLLPGLALLGASLTVVFVALTHEAVADVGADDRGAASGVFETGTHLGGGALAVALCAALMANGGHDAAYAGAGALALGGALLVAATGPPRP